MSNTNLDRARKAWGSPAPDWVEVLAGECDRTSQRAASNRIRYSSGLVCNVLQAKYTGDLTAVEQAVRGALMSATVDCPVVGVVSAEACISHQRRGFSTASPQSARLSRACPACPHSRSGGGHDQ